MELTPETKDALVGLFTVKLDLCSERSVEKALAKAQPGGLLKELTAMGAVKVSDHAALIEGLDAEVVPGYRIEAEAGRGGMGVVYRARQTSMDRVVALKLLSRRLACDESYVSKFLDEARSAAKLNHENVVGAINAGEANGLSYFVMEFVDGESVSEHLDSIGPYDYAEAFRIAEGVARGLEHAHDVGIVHRDVKPENVILTSTNEVRLCDLGLAKPLAVAGTGEKSDMTEGTPYYCSPEQALGRTDIDARSDIYSLALTLYHMLTGEPAYEGDGPREILLQQVRSPFPDLAKAMPDVPKPYRDLIAKMVVKEREDRMPSMRDFLRGLDAARRPQTVAPTGSRAPRSGPPPIALAAAALVGALGLGIVGWAAFGGGEPDPIVAEDDVPPDDDTQGEEPPPVDDDDDDAKDDPGGRRARRGRRRVDPDPPIEPPPNDPPSNALAEDALELARQYLVDHPDDPRGAYERLQGVATAFPGSEVADSATRGADALLARVERAGNKAFTDVSTSTRTLVGQHRYRTAVEGLDAFHESWRAILPDIPELDILRRTALEAGKTRLSELEEAGDFAALEAFSAEAPAELAESLQASIARAKQAEQQTKAREAFRTAEREFWTKLLQGDVAGARQLMQPFADAGEFKAEATAHLGDAVDVATARDAFEARCAARTGEQTFALDTSGERSGRVSSYSASQTSFALTDSRGTQSELSLSELSGPELMGILGDSHGASLRGCALYFLIAGAPQGARAALDRAEAAGVPMEAAARQEFEVQIRKLEEQLVDQRIASLSSLEPDDVVRLARGGFSPSLRATQAYRRGYAQVQEAFRGARGQQLAADPSGLLAGDFKRRRVGMSLEYDFASNEQAADFVPGGFTKSKAAWNTEGYLTLHGRVALRPRFAPGTLKIQAKLRAKDDQRPNLNLILSTGEWSGCLVGMGYRAGSTRDVTIDPAASRKGGFTMSLPCNVLGRISARPPAGFTCLAAEYSPSVLGSTSKVQRIQIERTKGNDVRVKLGGRSVFRVNDVSGDEPCQIVIAPFNQDVELSELEISGELDPGWLRERGEELASQEVGSIPPPL